MSPQAFTAAVLGWHDFYLAVSGAAAALLGLLFVGLSINLNAIAAEARVDLRARAGQAFANLTFVLVIALTMLIPDLEAGSMALGFAVIAAFGLVRVGRNLYRVFRRGPRVREQVWAMRRMGWTVVADLVLLFTAWRISSSASADSITNLVVVVFVLLIGAADVAWEMLIEVSRES